MAADEVPWCHRLLLCDHRLLLVPTVSVNGILTRPCFFSLKKIERTLIILAANSPIAPTSNDSASGQITPVAIVVGLMGVACVE
jgi:hypothetical protein